VVGIINHFILKTLILWKKVKVSLVFENWWPVALNKMFKKCAIHWITIKCSSYDVNDKTFI
jgi:hypothetical protein